ncbi:hypothetical protein [Sphingomonas sp. 10B4]|uniref:hypothetical protein n=1 Tax=Sphingomonas sp. 10B4 TaxID=3048575 RepID=UPI002AB49BDE|nr:hypothetical protein [Sphingomonas sp. 10B4]MDY7525371.1 hypothetical protein [Sphingomonas sp. 10B4]MEB0284173.1 hypothetical protein [Sphingomonas sp. 10B4]
MNQWDDRAARLQDSVRAAEQRNAEFSQYDQDDVARAVVHTRQDVVLLVSQLSSLNAQLRMVKWLLAFIAVAAAFFVYRAL